MPTLTRFVGKFCPPDEFGQYVQEASKRGSWKPIGITVHHTASPSLAQRPHGFTEQHIANIKYGYEHERGWNSGPHFFVDQHGIWVFVDPAYAGIHAASFNSTHHGVEMLGDYDTEAINTQVLSNLAVCIRECYKAWNYKAFNFHRDDPKTTKTCPGKHVNRDLIDSALIFALADALPKIVNVAGGSFNNGRWINNRVFVPVREFCAWAKVPKSYLLYSENGLHIDGNEVKDEIMIGGKCWAPLSEVAGLCLYSVTWDNAEKTAMLTKMEENR